ncbi:MAG: hypothetical protein RIF32_05965, partial [Leptospirales bacterium]
ELEAHQRANLQIFRAILKKKNATPDQAKAVLGKLQQYVAARIKAPDDFLDHIPNFAKGLAVRPEALSAFIGSNLLPALENVKKQMRAAAASAATAVAADGASAKTSGAAVISDAEAADSVLKELERQVGVIVADQQRFTGEDMGYLRLVSLNGGQDVPGKSLREAMGMPAAAAVEASPVSVPARVGDDGGAVPGRSAAPGAARDAAPPSTPASLRETSIIQEIIEQFGEELVVAGPLHVPAFPKRPGEAPAAAGPAGTAAPASGVPDAGRSGTVSDPGAGSAPAVSASAAVETEASVIVEILDQFGDELSVSGPLVLREAGGGSGGGPRPGVAPVAVEMEAAEPAAPVELPEVPLSFQQYMDVMRKLQEFQTSGDQGAYREWLTGAAGDGGKAMVGLRNVEARAKRGDAVHWPDEYEKISSHMHLHAGQIESLHRRIGRFQKLQQLLNQFIASVKAKEPALVGALKKIWPQVRLLFNDDWEADAMMSRLKIPLLQIPDPALKSRVQSLMLPLLQKAESLAKAS